MTGLLSSCTVAEFQLLLVILLTVKVRAESEGFKVAEVTLNLWPFGSSPEVGHSLLARHLDSLPAKGQIETTAYLSAGSVILAVWCALPVAELSHQLSLALEQTHWHNSAGHSWGLFCEVVF